MLSEQQPSPAIKTPSGSKDQNFKKKKQLIIVAETLFRLPNYAQECVFVETKLAKCTVGGGGGLLFCGANLAAVKLSLWPSLCAAAVWRLLEISKTSFAKIHKFSVIMRNWMPS